MNNRDYRYWYIAYAVVFIFVAIILVRIYPALVDPEMNIISYVASVSELLGLSIALTEIVVTTNLARAIRSRVQSISAFGAMTLISADLSHSMDEIVSKRYGRAIVRLQKIRNVYQEHLPQDELLKIESEHRRNYDKINSIISSLSVIELNKKGKLADADIQDYIKFLTAFDQTLISLKNEFKTSIQ